MATEVKLPDLGEGVEDATISRWLVKEGDEVKEGDIILEVATDKVDTEIPAPAAGKVLKINHGEGSLVALSDVIALIGADGESASGDDHNSQRGSQATADGDAKRAATQEKAQEAEARDETEDDLSDGSAEASQTVAKPSATESTAPKEKAERTPQISTPSENGATAKASPVAKRVAAEKGVDLEGVSGTGPGGRITKDDVLASADGEKGDVATGTQLEALPGDLGDTAPLSVLRLAAQYNVNLREIAAGRPLSTLTRYDVLNAEASRDAGKSMTVETRYLPPRAVPGTDKAIPATGDAAESAEKSESKPAPEKAESKAVAPKVEGKAQPREAVAQVQGDVREDLVKHTRMRQAIARNTTQSWTSTPHVTTIWDVDMSAVANHRKAHKNEFAAAGVNLTITAYFVEAIVAGLKAVPAANASYSDEGVIIKRYYNIGMAVALPQDQYGLGGLIAPVIKDAGDLNLMGIARAVNELADKARKNQLRADDLADGTFTLTNYGTSGSRLQTPIIVQPQAGILGAGVVEKRAVVVSKAGPLEASAGDSLAFLPMVTLSFSYDHRVLDGATADAFCAAVKKALESYQ